MSYILPNGQLVILPVPASQPRQTSEKDTLCCLLYRWKPAEVVTSKQPFFDAGAGSSKMSVTQLSDVFTGPSPVQATRDVTATQPVEPPSTMMGSAASMTATRPVEAPGIGR